MTTALLARFRLLDRAPQPGDVLWLTDKASPQFARGLTVRATKVAPRKSTVAGWLWVEGYQLNERGEATARRSVFVNASGLYRATSAYS